ncbi:MAG: hypothetical protein ACOCV2_02205 [Persicimonas sp.]
MSQRDDGEEPTKDTSDAGSDAEFDEVLSSLEQDEKQRRRRGLMYLGLVVAGIAVLTTIYVMFGDELFEGPVDVERSEQMALEETDDPQCREMIERVERLGERYYKLEDDVDEHLLADDRGEIEKISEESVALREELAEAEEDSQEANLRFDRSRKELDDWFAYVGAELENLSELADDRLAKLKDEAEDAKDDGGDGEGDESEEGGDAEEEEAEEEEAEEEEAEEEEEDSSPEDDEESFEERRDDLLVGLHDSFENFRVWHSSAQHPCGAAEEGEEPWRPDEGDEAADESPRESDGEAEE